MRKRIEIHGDVWMFRSISARRYETLHGTDSVAITDIEIKTIDFKKGEVSLGTIIHEITHLFFHYAPVGTMTSTTVADWEEIFCEFNAKYLNKVNAISLELYVLLCGDSLKTETKNIIKQHIKAERKLSKLCDLSLE